MAQILNHIYNCLDGTLVCAKTVGSKETKPFLHRSLGKAGPFTLESHIHVNQSFKMQGFSNN